MYIGAKGKAFGHFRTVSLQILAHIFLKQKSSFQQLPSVNAVGFLGVYRPPGQLVLWTESPSRCVVQGVFQNEVFSQKFLGDSNSICISTWAGLCPSWENVYDYRNVFVVTAFEHPYKIHSQIYKGNPWVWVCFSFGFDPSSDVMDQTGQVLQYSCALTEKSEANQPCFTAAITPRLLVSHLRCSKAAVRGVPQGIEV